MIYLSDDFPGAPEIIALTDRQFWSLLRLALALSGEPPDGRFFGSNWARWHGVAKRDVNGLVKRGLLTERAADRYELSVPAHLLRLGAPKLLAVIPDAAREKALHELLAGWRLEGEWFSPDVIELLEGLK